VLTGLTCSTSVNCVLACKTYCSKSVAEQASISIRSTKRSTPWSRDFLTGDRAAGRLPNREASFYQGSVSDAIRSFVLLSQRWPVTIVFCHDTGILFFQSQVVSMVIVHCSSLAKSSWVPTPSRVRKDLSVLASRSHAAPPHFLLGIGSIQSCVHANPIIIAQHGRPFSDGEPTRKDISKSFCG
jgi:hypothetical protein